jgi:hypothetical protein
MGLRDKRSCRAPCVEAARRASREVTLWEGDFTTWLIESSTQRSRSKWASHTLNACLATFDAEAGIGGCSDGAPPDSAYRPPCPQNTLQPDISDAAKAAIDPFYVQRSVEQVVSHLCALATSSSWRRVRHIILEHLLTTPCELVCYCLGDLGEGQPAYQLALFLLLANELRIPPARRLVFDPVHTAKDRQILAMCGCTAMTWDENAARRVQIPTLFYMPFAPFDLTESLVRANWGNLHHVAIIGNPLDFVTGLRLRDEEQDGGEDEDGGCEDEDEGGGASGADTGNAGGSQRATQRGAAVSRL